MGFISEAALEECIPFGFQVLILIVFFCQAQIMLGMVRPPQLVCFSVFVKDVYEGLLFVYMSN